MVLHHIAYIDHLVILGGCHPSQTDLIFMQFHHHSHQVFPRKKVTPKDLAAKRSNELDIGVCYGLLRCLQNLILGECGCSSAGGSQIILSAGGHR